MKGRDPGCPAQHRFTADESRWEAVRCRDPAARGQFVYAVKTTRVYCRPDCASRLPKRPNVVFFTSGQAAERAGFRACKRCQPDGRDLIQEHTLKVAAACRTIENSEVSPSL